MPWIPYAVQAVIALASVAQGAVSYQASREQAKTTKVMTDYNAALQERDAEQQRLDSQEQLNRSRRSYKMATARERASLATSGVATEGSPLEVLGWNAGMMELEAQDMARASRSSYARSYADAAMTRLEGAAAVRGYRRQGTAAIINTVGNVASSFARR